MDIGLRDRRGLVLALAKQLAFHEPQSGELDILMDVERDRPHNRFNDGKVDRRGRYWAGTMDDAHWDRPSGALYRLDGDLGLARVHGDVACANGLGWSPGDCTFFPVRASATRSRLRLRSRRGRRLGQASLRHGRQELGGVPERADVDADGGVWSVHNGAGRVVRYAPDGAITHEIEPQLPQPTSCIFGGRDLDVLYITSSWRNTQIRRSVGPLQLSGDEQ